MSDVTTKDSLGLGVGKTGFIATARDLVLHNLENLNGGNG